MNTLPPSPIIYAIWIVKDNDKYHGIYVGSTRNGKSRRGQHLRSLKNGSHDNKRLQLTWYKYGIRSLRFEVLEHIDECSKLISREQFWIDTLVEKLGRRFLFNICLTATNRLGCEHSNETKRKIGLGNKGKKVSIETREKLSAAGKIRFSDPKEREKQVMSHRGKKHTDRARQNMSNGQRARYRKNPLSGITWSREKRKFLVRTKINGQHKHICYSTTLDEAITARDAALRDAGVKL
jgi:group I intron endonuclease